MKFNRLIALLQNSSLDIRVYTPEGMCAFDPEITKVVSDSRKIVNDSLFACVEGEHIDGHHYAAKAVEDGASALLCQRQLDIPVPQIICADVRRSMGVVASILYGAPLSKLTMIAITGTNGKTTSTFMTKSILENAGIKTGLLGTVYYDDGDVLEDAEHTTPEGSDLQYWLYRMVNNGCDACVMETSSHAIVQGRIEGALYDRAGFTNLSVDHLDYHGDMESYFLAKKTLFDCYMRNNWRAAVNIDDAYGARLFKELGNRAVGFSIKDSSAHFFAAVTGTSIEGMDVKIKIPDSDAMEFIRLPLLGEYNILNALQALSLAWTLGVSKETALDGLLKMGQIPGRLERYLINGSGSCVIDFAHSPDGLEKVLTALRPVCRGKLYVVFGAGGDRDKTKRPLMGEIATRLADSVIITSDNPRSEDPDIIASEIESGAKRHSTEYKVIVDRRTAIYEGLNSLKPDDVLLIAGKGPERYQILKDGPIPFLDKNIMLDWCRLNNKQVI
ncbi:MAG: UDP-N-acetylmuramoyl-L-alanyl-D-glutamate--2,6-diaminopimelate ligase [Synergistaceae bacterium]|nr:UDP-N-acetylmuramoyl-L-alanyl-D-glutamate--2,6-diaminopimelate ligase [Synergistaceae bacterium]